MQSEQCDCDAAMNPRLGNNDTYSYLVKYDVVNAEIPPPWFGVAIERGSSLTTVKLSENNLYQHTKAQRASSDNYCIRRSS